MLQAADINALFGFRLECMERLGHQGIFAWNRINSMFNWLPLAALIEDRIVCMHGGEHKDICNSLPSCTFRSSRPVFLPLLSSKQAHSFHELLAVHLLT